MKEADSPRFKFHEEQLFEPELALLVGLQVVSSKEGGAGRREGELSDKFFGSHSQELKYDCWIGWKD